MIPPEVIVAPAFFAIPIALTRPRGQRLIAAVAIHAIYLAMFGVLFSGIAVGNRLAIALFYGINAAIVGEPHAVRDRPYLELSNGDKYLGASRFLWNMIVFVSLAAVGFCVVTAGRWTHRYSPLAQRVVARLRKALPAR